MVDITIVSSGGVVVCIPLDAGGALHANARLLGAAPALLDAVRACRIEIRALRAACGAGLLTDRTLHQADQAIHDATGEAS